MDWLDLLESKEDLCDVTCVTPQMPPEVAQMPLGGNLSLVEALFSEDHFSFCVLVPWSQGMPGPSSPPRDHTHTPCIGRRSHLTEPPGKSRESLDKEYNISYRFFQCLIFKFIMKYVRCPLEIMQERTRFFLRGMYGQTHSKNTEFNRNIGGQ